MTIHRFCMSRLWSLTVLLTVLPILTSLAQTTYSTVQNGDFGTATTWDCNCVPANPLPVGSILHVKHNITISVAFTNVGTIDNIGSITTSSSFVNNGIYGGNGTFNGNFINNGTTSPGYILPVLTTAAATDVTGTTATSGGNISESGKSAVTARGVCYSTSPMPDLSDSHTTDGAGIGAFISDLTGLSPNSTYYTRAYATNGQGTAFGNQVTFCSGPVSPTAGTHVPSQTQIDWNWNAVLGATGYKYNTANDYSTATDNGTSTTYTQTGLTCNTPYTLYVWAYNACGRSLSATLTQNTQQCFQNCTPGFGNGGLLTNGVYAPEGTLWNDATYAVQLNNSGCYIAWDLGSPTSITRIKAQLDCNDNYRIEYSLDFNTWTTLWDVPTATCNGLRTRTNPSVSATARYLKLTVSGGDGFYSGSEVEINYCVPPGQPTTGTHVPSQTQIEWNWNAVAEATGYKYNIANDYATATDNGNSTTYTQTGLSCNTPYTLYVWAYNACGNSTALTLNSTTTACPFVCGTSTVTFTYKGSSVTFGTVSSANSTCWLDRNLGASRVAIGIQDADAYGDLFQWGRLDDGHQVRTSPTTTTLSNSDVPGHNMFIKGMGPPYDWRTPQNNNLWQGEGGVNNPCPDGYRLPTQTEWDAERASWSTNNAAGAFASPLKLPMAGYRTLFEGLVFSEGSYGFYWSRTVSGIGSWYLRFYSDDAYMSNDYRAYGFSVRCIQD